MRKYFFAVLAIAVIVMSGCKKKSSNDPTTPTEPTEPVETSDSMDINIRIYATVDQMKYVDYRAFVTPQGEAEKELKLVETVALDTNCDKTLQTALIFMGFNRDSLLIYDIGMRVKKGEQSLRFSGTVKDTVMPEYINFISGYSFNKTVSSHLSEIYGKCEIFGGVICDNLNGFLGLKDITGPYKVTVR